MSLIRLTTLAQLQARLNPTARSRPAMIMVGSASCPPCRAVRPDVSTLAARHPHFDFHYFDVDLFEDHPQEPQLATLFAELSLKFLPSHILLPVAGPTVVVCASRIDALTRALIDHHILRSAPFHARRPDHRLLKRHRPRPRRQLQAGRLQRLGDRPQGR